MFDIHHNKLKFEKKLLICLLALSLSVNTIYIYRATNLNPSDNDISHAGKHTTTGETSDQLEEDFSGELLPYQHMYPNMYATSMDFNFIDKENRTVYLTFDDGPSKLTAQILDILKQTGVKATFFVVYNDTEYGRSIYKRIIDEGHAIGVHTTTHSYLDIYSSVESYLSDFEKTHSLIQEVTGVNTRLYRFPGGSINSYNRSNYQAIIAEMYRRGFIYYDWTVDSKDTSSNPNAEIVTGAVIGGISGKHASIVLLHDAGAKTYTVEALPIFIQIIKDSVYDFAALDDTVKPAQFAYKE